MTAPTTALRGRTRTRSAAGAPPKTLRRETHQPDYIILVAVIAMSAIGILMVFSSSAMKEYARDGDVFGRWHHRWPGASPGSSRCSV